jgi:hypothetical protein
MRSSELIDSLLRDQQRVKELAHLFLDLDEQQLNWKPSTGKWSIGECLDHLNVTGGMYIDRIKKISRTGKRTAEDKEFRSGMIGAYLARVVDPASVKTYKSPKVFKPVSSGITTAVLDIFLAQQDELTELIELCRNYDLIGNMLSSPVNRLFTLRLGDALIITLRHDERHLLQAKRVMEIFSFPR